MNNFVIKVSNINHNEITIIKHLVSKENAEETTDTEFEDNDDETLSTPIPSNSINFNNEGNINVKDHNGVVFRHSISHDLDNMIVEMQNILNNIAAK